MPSVAPLPAPYAAWLAEAGAAGLRHALAEALGDADARWRHTGLGLYDPAHRGGPRLDPLPDPGALLSGAHPARRAQGVYYTPDAVADAVVAATWDGDGPVRDPACGAGAFLLAALRALPAARRAAFASTGVEGTDLDPLAVLLTQARIAAAAGLGRVECAALGARVRVADALREPRRAVRTVLTNPPFQSRLRTLTAPDAALAAALRSRHGDALGPYTDVSVVFLLDALRDAERVGIVLPASVCATRDAAGARARAGAPAWAWTLPPDAFPEVGVPLVALGFGPGGPPTRRFVDLPPRPAPPADAAPDDWAALLAHDRAPPWAPAPAGRTLGEVARVEADFRDEYYALQGHVREGGAGLRVVTSGGVGLGRLSWGERPARIHKARWLRPTVPAAALHPRQAARVGPRLYVATQTRVLEVAADPVGDSVGLTPVLTVLPAGWPLDDLLAVLLSPPASAWARRVSLGSALGLGVLKLSAAQLRELPLPAEVPDAARAAVAALLAGDDTALDTLASVMTDAYGAPEAVLAWWRREAG